MPEDESLIEIAKKLKLTVPFLLIGILGFAYILGMQVYPVWQEIQELKVNIETQSEVLVQKQRELDDLKAQVKKQQEAETLEKEIFVPTEKGLPAEDMISGEFSEILELIRANTIKTRSISFEYNPKKDTFVQGAPQQFNVAALDMDMIATYKNFENFLKDLYKHDHFLEITSIDIEPYEKDKKVLLIKFKMKLYAKKA